MRIVQAHGCFDLLHLGHIRHLRAARALGDYLVVTVTPDAYVNKGPGRPVFSQAQRMEALDALACVDAVESSDAPTATEAIQRIRPAVFAKGPDYSPATMDPGEVAAIAAVGGEIVITEDATWSSTALLQRASHPPEVDAYLACLRQRYTAADVLGWLEHARGLQVVVVGDAITDEYVYCHTLGKSGKEPILAAQYQREEMFVGGADAVGRHVAAICPSVEVLTGEPVLKRRFIETYPFQKLFELYELPAAPAAGLKPSFGGRVERADVVIVADYGHGFITSAHLEALAQAKYLAVNTQANAGNHGFNTIGKYRRADFISLSERELRLDARDQVTDVRALMRRVANPRKARLLITRGEKGCMAYDAADGFHEGVIEAPALATYAVDRMGAGDAVFGVAACCAAVGMPLDLLTFVAAVVGTQAVGIVGNSRHIERQALQEAITAWLR